jgi:hypothetical protein
MIAPWLVSLLISVALNVVAYIITPKPKAPKPQAAAQAENPTAEAGRPIPVVFGTMRVKELNVLGFWDKSTKQFQIQV